MSQPRTFPWWIPLTGCLLAALYIPTLSTPFDFIDDGNLVYPSESVGSIGQINLWWCKVAANYEHLGPFRPTLWIHWQLQANLFDGNPLIWRTYRLLWCGLASTMLLWLMRELGVNPIAAILATAVAMWNPYRNEIWTSLTLAEGVAMPYALFGLIAARKASISQHPLRWEIASSIAVLIALGCKNVFAALVPVQILLRMWPEGHSFREVFKRNGWRALALGVSLILPIAHFIYFKLHWHPGQYETQPLSLAQLGRILNGLKGAMSLEFLGLGIALAGLTLYFAYRRNAITPSDSLPKITVICASILLAGGIAMYMPMGMISGRYAMPGVWGLDILFGLLLTQLLLAPPSLLRRSAWCTVVLGVILMGFASIGRQEKFAARAKMLWRAIEYVESHAPHDAGIVWLSGDSLKGGLNIEEGIHFQWHLYHRGRGDLVVGLFDESGLPLPRIELPPLCRRADFAMSGEVDKQLAGWEFEREFSEMYWIGRKHYNCILSHRRTEQVARGDSRITSQQNDQFSR